MLPINNRERLQKFKRFAFYYGLSLAAVCIIVFSFKDGMTGGTSTTAGVAPETNAIETAFSADSLLQEQWSALENMDDRYDLATMNHKSRNESLVRDSLRRMLPKTEQDFQFSLDSVSRLSRTNNNPALKQTVDFFATALALRMKRRATPRNTGDKAFSSILSGAAPGNVAIDELIRTNPELKEVMLKKDIRIADMEATISDLKKNMPAKNNASADAGTGAMRQLQQDYETLQKNYRSLAETNMRLRNNVSKPGAAITEKGDVKDNTDKAATGESAETDAVKAARARAQKMELQLQEMNADLSFSTVDCNLSRADVNQIIYNGKQRKLLLQQALDILTALKKSGDQEVQKRAMQKIGQLNRIAMTVRD